MKSHSRISVYGPDHYPINRESSKRRGNRPLPNVVISSDKTELYGEGDTTAVVKIDLNSCEPIRLPA
jgi:hypothetical protein